MAKTQALLIIDHGSVREAANQMLEEVGKMIQEMRPDLIVEIAHMELADPTIATGINNCVKEGAREIIAHPYMLSPGRHSTKDIPEMVYEVAKNYPEVNFRVTHPLGIHKKICAVVLDRAGFGG